MSLISAGSFSLDSTFAQEKMSKEDQDFLDVVRIVFCLIPTS
jgi:hypothetical protein